MQPKYRIIANKSDITKTINGRLLSLEITDEIGIVSDSLTMQLDDRDGMLAVPPRGAELVVFMGYDELYEMGRFIVDEIELKSPPQTMIITARASNSMLDNIAAFKAPQTYSWDKKPLGEIIETIAGKYGLSAAVAESYKELMVTHLDQTEESDCAFIQRLASDYNASVKIAGGKLMFISPLSGQFPDGRSMPTISIGKDISGYHYKITERGKYGQVIAKYYDFDMAEEKQVSAGAGSPVFTLRDIYTTEDLAAYRAKQKLTEIMAGTESLTLDLVGNPALTAESIVNVHGIRSDACGQWIVISAKHTMNTSGYKTTIENVRRAL
ncbi:MAG: hypothetical protein IJL05_04005 [Alphaproteobacteria bacterium]|nr:hypothetical protein [Alphaproteobacteria bacterium]